MVNTTILTSDAQKQFSLQGTHHQYLCPQIPNVEGGIQFPLDRQSHLPANRLGSELLEGYDNAGRVSCLGFWETLLLIILIVILIYGIYWLYKSNSVTL